MLSKSLKALEVLSESLGNLVAQGFMAGLIQVKEHIESLLSVLEISQVTQFQAAKNLENTCYEFRI